MRRPTLLLAACARPPRALRGSFAPITVRDAQAGTPVGERVRWGGTMVNARPGRDETCFEIVSKPLEEPERVVYYDPWYDPFWGPGPYWGWGGGGFVAVRVPMHPP